MDNVQKVCKYKNNHHHKPSKFKNLVIFRKIIFWVTRYTNSITFFLCSTIAWIWRKYSELWHQLSGRDLSGSQRMTQYKCHVTSKKWAVWRSRQVWAVIVPYDVKRHELYITCWDWARYCFHDISIFVRELLEQNSTECHATLRPISEPTNEKLDGTTHDVNHAQQMQI
jgi:hypothetical protein